MIATRLLIFLFWTAHADVSTLNQLEEADELLLNQLEQYIVATEDEINLLKQMAEKLRLNSTTSQRDHFTSSNPLNAFKSVRRLVRDWNEIRPLVTESQSKNEAQRKWTTIMKGMNLPTEEDVEVAAEALIKLQNARNIPTTSLAKGELPDFSLKQELNAVVPEVKSGTRVICASPKSSVDLVVFPFLADDCFELGRFAYRQLNYNKSIQWMNEALVRYRIDKEWKDTGPESEINSLEWTVYEYLSYSIFKEGEKDRAVNLSTNIIKNFNEDHEKTWLDLELFKSIHRFNPDPAVYATEGGKVGITNSTYGTDNPRFLSMCASGAPTRTNLRQKCRYVSRSAFSRLARIKEEEVNLDPKVSIFRNVIYDSEIEILKRIAALKSHNMTIGSMRTQDVKIQLDPVKFVKEVNVTVEDTEIIQRILKRSEDITGLSLARNKNVYVLHYIMSGQVSTHFDFDHDNKRTPHMGNRIATLLYHMSDFEGGETAFPELDVSVKPGKGSASIWYNLLASGGDETRSLHGGCPVRRGGKWVLAVAVYTLGNEFNRPCSLNPFE